MARRPPTLRQADLLRALKAALQAGMKVAEALIARDGSIRLVFDTGQGVASSTDNPLDQEFGCGRH
jgi:hypothetical protein